MNQPAVTMHQKIWNVLINLGDEKRIKKDDLMEKVGLSDERRFYSIIEDLRRDGFQIGASKSTTNPGYYQCRTDKQVWDYLFGRIKMLEREMDRVKSTATDYFFEKYGQDFDFDAAYGKEELRRLKKELNEDGEGDDKNGSC